LSSNQGNGNGLKRRDLLLSGSSLLAASALTQTGLTHSAQAQPAPAPTQPVAGRPNILIIFGDDIGQTNVSAYSMGLMGYRTPNIDRIAKEGMIFTDYYAEQSCTAGRSSFITGQATLRTGLSKVGIPGATVGLQARDATIAELLKPLGYSTGQFGKNHLGDRNEYLPTVHGFDEFFGNLYHLNAEEDPEDFNYPRDPKFTELFGPRGVLRCKATTEDDLTEQPRWDRVGKVCTKLPRATGPLCATRSASTNPGGGSSQSANVRTGTLRLIAAEGADRRRVAVPACRRISRNARSIVAALIASNLARTSGTSWTWPCRSMASSRIGTSGRSRLPQIRSDASQTTISASRTASS
jgi:Sulfatase